jgi:Flp pilus assembly pilin Flp
MTDLLTRFYIQVTTLARREQGQTMAEYGIILVVLALIAAVAFGLLATDIGTALDKVGDKLAGR